MSEGNILVLGEALTTAHDLIMIVGKEPNNNLKTVNRIDTYGDDWTEKGRGTSCQFWNMAYSLCGKITGHSRASLKGICASKKTSPVIFSDISPRSLNGKYSSSQKKKIRAQISEADYDLHIDTIFSHGDVMGRVKLVLFTRAYVCGLTVGRTIFEKKCEDVNLQYVNIASLNSRRHTVESRIEEIGPDVTAISRAFDRLVSS